MTHERTTSTGPDGTKYSEIRNTYTWFDSAQTSIVDDDPDVDAGGNGGDPMYGTSHAWQSIYSYDARGYLTGVDINDGQPRQVTFVDDANGQVMQRAENPDSGTSIGPTEYHFAFGGIAVGDLGNNGTSDVDYAVSIAEHRAKPATGSNAGLFAYGGSGSGTVTGFASGNGSGVDFQEAYDPINGLTYENTASSYTVQDGDTLRTIAQRIWGDSSFWYMIADANGLTGTETLVAGQTLSIPNKVHNSHNSSDVFKVYDPNEAIGDNSPTHPKPQKLNDDNGCGVMGQILLVAIAVAVAALTYGALIGPMATFAASSTGLGLSAGIVTADAVTIGATGVVVGSEAAIAAGVMAGVVSGALGSIVSQGVGLATGIQSKFDWGAVGIAAIAGGVSGGMGPEGLNAFSGVTDSTFIQGALRGVTSNILTQGISVATGLQKRFDWTGVATAGVVSGVANWVGGQLPADMGHFGANLVSGMAGAIAGAGVKTLLNGRDFGDNLMSLLPDAIGATIGNAIGEAVGGTQGTTTDTDGSESITPSALPSDNRFGLRNLHMTGIGAGSDWDHPYLNTSNLGARTGADVGGMETVIVTAPGWYNGFGQSYVLATNARYGTPAETQDGRISYWNTHRSASFPNTSVHQAPDSIFLVSDIRNRWNQAESSWQLSDEVMAQIPNAPPGDADRLWAEAQMLRAKGNLQTLGVFLAPLDATLGAALESKYHPRTEISETAASLGSMLIVGPETGVLEIGAEDVGVFATRSELTSGRGTYFFDEKVLPYIDRPEATLGQDGDMLFFMPAEDSGLIVDAETAYRYSGGAPSLERAYVDGGEVFGVEFPTAGLSVRSPSPGDSTLGHWLEGGFTALRLPDSGGYLINPTRELVVPGGNPMPSGAVLFKIAPDGTRVPIRRW